MLDYHIRTPDNVDVKIKIKLLDTEFVNKWKTYLKNIMSQVHLNWLVVKCGDNKRYRTDNKIREFLVHLKLSYSLLNENALGEYEDELQSINSLLKNPSDIDQSMLNHWHRQFTALELLHSRNGYVIPTNIDPNLVRNAIHNINKFVHLLEGATYYKTPRRMDLGITTQYAIQFTNSTNPDDNAKSVWDLSDRLNIGIFDWNKEDINHTVWLNEDILGKDQMKAWLDHDDLTQWDCTGNFVITPSIILDPNRLYYKVFNNPEFQAESIACNKTVDRPPLGNIINIDEIEWSTVPGSTVIKIELDGEILWEL